MGLADRKAEEIEKRTEQEDIRLQLRLRSVLISDTAAPNMWDIFVAAIEEEVKKFAARVPGANSLRADLENSNNLTVRTTLSPLHTLVILRTRVGIQAALAVASNSRLKNGGRTANLPPIFFSTDSNLKPCFSDYDTEISLEMAINSFLEPLFDLF